MLRPLALVLLAICCGCTAHKKSDPLVGDYVGWAFLDGKAKSYDGSMGTSIKLALKPNGHYTFESESSVMYQMSDKATGTYTSAGDDVALVGTLTHSTKDAYGQSTDTFPQNLKLRSKNGMLVLKVDTGDLYFLKQGTGPPPLPPQLQLKQSDAAAVALIERVKEAYASLKSLKVTGFVRSKGAGNVAEHAQFKMLFQRPSRFRFEGWIRDAGIERDRTEITWDGGAKCWWYSMQFGETTDRTLGNALSMQGTPFGPESYLVPPLLLPTELSFGGLSVDIYPETTLLPNEKVDGKVCAVLQLRTKGADASKLWIDKSNGMILRFYEGLDAATVTFEPHPDVAIEPKEFNFGKRSKS